MSDLIGGPSANNGRGSGRPQNVPVTTGSPSGVRGPRDIMRERVAREQRRKEQQEKENMERARAQEEARLIEEDRRKSAERRAAAAAGAGEGAQRGSGQSSQRISGGTAGQRISDNSQRDRRSGDRVTSDPNQPLQGVGRGGPAIGGGSASRPRPTQSNQQPRPVQPDSRHPSQSQAGPSQPIHQAEPVREQTAEDRVAATRSSFPHAFERWETLSAHWEGLTSFWIRRLQENSSEINRDPVSTQLARQVTDLTAAGANLFHAVVELQRLRASSERKFQRWFFDTRAEQERSQEILALLQRTLDDERQSRAVEVQAAVQAAVEEERSKHNNNAEKQLVEMKRELQISKEEARRAWEELGRREQEERERTASLRDGHPTLVGGVQVVPMMQGVPSRHGSTRDVPPTRDGLPVVQEPLREEPLRQEPLRQAPLRQSDLEYQQYSQAQRTEPADPFVDYSATSSRPGATSSGYRPNVGTSTSSPYAGGYSQAPAVQPTSNSFYQQHQGTSLHPMEPEQRYGPSVPSEAAFSEEEYEIDGTGDFIRDDKGNKVPYPVPISDDGTDEYDVASEREREAANLQRYGQNSGIEYGQGPTSTAGRVPAPTSQPANSGPDYSGQGYGSGPGWETVPRHHHPTRLSDVLEEDERSRTSASQVSRRE